jgi:hypothetical protein
MTKFLLRALLISTCFTAVISCAKSDDSTKPQFKAPNVGPVGTEKDPVKSEPVKELPAKDESPVTDLTSKPALQPILDMGKRAVTWLNLVNTNRDLQNRLNLADRTTKNPVPPEKPKVTSVKILLDKFNEKVAQIPEAMKPYLIGNQPLVELPPVADADFLKSIRDLNGAYQGAVRWLGEEPYFNEYASNDILDIRGVYFTKKDADIETKLTNFAANTPEQIATYEGWLVSICHNSEITHEACAAELATAEKDSNVIGFYKKYIEKAAKTYEDFFAVNPIRKDISWSNDKFTITQKFVQPPTDKVATWLKTNIEEEWQSSAFKLLIEFVEKNPISPFIVFEKGVTPHVSGNNWETITMDPDYSLDDFDTQWTIRHEFGHILGFPDCYLEFFNSAEKTMTYYTIEPDNLMCAWGGKLKPSHEAELRKAYK